MIDQHGTPSAPDRVRRSHDARSRRVDRRALRRPCPAHVRRLGTPLSMLVSYTPLIRAPETGKSKPYRNPASSRVRLVRALALDSRRGFPIGRHGFRWQASNARCGLKVWRRRTFACSLAVRVANLWTPVLVRRDPGRTRALVANNTRRPANSIFASRRRTADHELDLVADAVRCCGSFLADENAITSAPANKTSSVEPARPNWLSLELAGVPGVVSVHPVAATLERNV